MALFGEELSGQQAAQWGLAWQALAANAVDSRALELAHSATEDPELARTATHMLRKMTAEPVDWDIAMEAERSAQMWSLRRRNEQGASPQ